MKLESIKNEKFVLNKKEMGALVGGARIYESTAAWGGWSADGIVYASERDKKAGIDMGYTAASIADDKTYIDNWLNEQKKKNGDLKAVFVGTNSSTSMSSVSSMMCCAY